MFQRLHASPHPSLQQAFCGMPPLTSQPFGVKNCESHDLYPFSQERPAVWEKLRVKQPNIACTMFLCQDLAFSLAWVQMKICNGSDHPKESLLRGAFSLEQILGIREQLAASHVNSQSLLNARPDYPRKQRKVNPTNAAGFLRGAFSLEKTRNVGAITASHVNLQSPRRQDALSLKKHMESGRVSATHVLVEKRYGIRERLVACHMNLQSH